MKELIDKSALVAEIERLKSTYSDDENIHHVTRYNLLVDILSFLDTLEVKEVDFIEKACEFLYKTIWNITYEDLEGNSTENTDKINFIETFKTYMKEE